MATYDRMSWNLAIENVAGIREGEATLKEGVNAVRASNWQGKSSLLAAIETAMGTETPLTEGQDEGGVTLTTDTDEYTVELVQEGNSVQQYGRPYLTDESVRSSASLYAFLDATNEVRAAVRAGENLEDVLTRPLDFENIDEKISESKSERRKVETELENARAAAADLPEAQERVKSLRDELSVLREKRAELDEKRDGDEDEGESTREELSSARAKRDHLASQVEKIERSIERTETKLEERRTELEELDVPSDQNLATELEDIREAHSEIERDLELLQSVYATNKRILEEDRLELITDIDRGLIGDEIECWVCGNAADREAFADQLDSLADRIADLRSKEQEYEREKSELVERREEIQQAQRRESDLRDEIESLEATLAEREESLEQNIEELAAVEETVERLSEEVAETNNEITDVESDIKYAKNEIEDAESDLESLQAEANRRETLSEEYDRLTDEIVQLRNRKDEIKRRTREAFEESIQDILLRFDTGFETARLTGQFELVVARDGREASTDALSEGELEILGILAALAGHEAFSVAEDVPVLLLDGIGGLTEKNLSELVDYLEGRAEYLIFTAYPEHEIVGGNEVNPAKWRIVSRENEIEA